MIEVWYATLGKRRQAFNCAVAAVSSVIVFGVGNGQFTKQTEGKINAFENTSFF